jgi:hypothetical protein
MKTYRIILEFESHDPDAVRHLSKTIRTLLGGAVMEKHGVLTAIRTAQDKGACACPLKKELK